jgi:hypothetical protein
VRFAALDSRVLAVQPNASFAGGVPGGAPGAAQLVTVAHRGVGDTLVQIEVLGPDESNYAKIDAKTLYVRALARFVAEPGTVRLQATPPPSPPVLTGHASSLLPY